MSHLIDSTDSAWFRAAEAEQPLRGELLSIDHLRVHATDLAKSLVVSEADVSDARFQQHFKRNAERLKFAHRVISEAIRDGEQLTPEAEWLLDNFYVVQEQLREIHDDLPRSYFNELPKLADGKPRIYEIAHDLIVHTDSVVQQDDLTAFVDEFQRVAPLSIGEVWALPIMLRLALVDNLRRLAGQMLATIALRADVKELLRDWHAGDQLPELLQNGTSRSDIVANTFTILGDLFPDDPPRFAACEQALLERFPASTTELIRAEHRRQAMNQVSIGNVITSMRLISALDWMSFFEQTNLVERKLRQDPSGIYPTMDQDTRNRYRTEVEELAKRSHRKDIDVAEKALERARACAAKEAATEVKNHIGYWLVDDGRREFERELGYQPKLKQLIPRLMLASPLTTYLGMIASILTVGLLLCAWLAIATNASAITMVILVFAVVFPLSEFAVSFTNWLVTHVVSPKLLPKLELKGGVPHEYRTFVIVPAMLTGRKEVSSLLDRLELHFVSNSEAELRFALLTDFADAPLEHMEKDAELVAQAVAGIRKLNERYSQSGHKPFYLFHRRRQWNEQEGCWMGWERKRGKLVEFNQRLRGDMNTSYDVIEGDLSVLATSGQVPSFPFVITLDADTQLPLGTARRLIGTLAHPLNRARLNQKETRTIHGYSILQPRVSVQLSDGNKSRFTQLFANGKGIDPYATAASDVYQDLFGEGSFTGKGIYDVAAFEALLHDAFDENQILSHDLIEGCHVRVGLVSDIELIDGFPTRYDAEARRSHRWVRGDWQIAPWLFPRVPCRSGSRPNRLTLISRWKIFDNLRRSLVSPGTCLLLLAAWFLAPGFAFVWGLVAGLGVGFPIVASLANAILGLPRPEFAVAQLRAFAADVFRTILQTGVVLAGLPYRAYLMLDAICRTLYRMCVSHRKMLEWETAASTERRLSKGQWTILINMSFVSVLTIVVALGLPQGARLAAGPWLLIWMTSPLIAQWVSQPLPRVSRLLNDEDHHWLRLMARSTWSFFETHVNSQTNWLPPDNLQEYPDEKVAERISPTNEGLFLVSAIVARDFGFIGLHALLDLCEKNLTVWRGLPQLNGHFYNWYETSTLQPLVPRYVSTVDSGNLAASLLVIDFGLNDVCRAPTFNATIWEGLQDVVTLAIDACDQLQPRGAQMLNPPLDNLHAELDSLKRFKDEPADSWSNRVAVLSRLRDASHELPRLLQVFVDTHRQATGELESRIKSLVSFIDSVDVDFQRFVPWADQLLVVQDRVSSSSFDRGFLGNWESIQKHCNEAQSVDQFAQLQDRVAADFAALEEFIHSKTSEPDHCDGLREMLSVLKQSVVSGSQAAAEVKLRCRALGQQAEEMALGMEFGFLFNPERRLFSIGYNLEDGKLDRSHYDMLCSEARLASQLAIAKGDVSHKHWFQLGRQLTITAGQPGLLSWGGTMFEFLMPLLFQVRFPDSLLSQACEAAVARQIEYGKQNGVPWGVSESAFASHAINSDYNYQSFGVPGLGLKRGLSEDLVVAPYATMLALAIDPRASVINLRRLAAEGGLGRFGFYDAVDYTPSRLPAGTKALPVRCYMAHHQAMSLVAIANALHDQVVERRFNAHPIVRATELLLQEAIPTAAPVLQPHEDEATQVRSGTSDEVMVSRRIVGHETPAPRTHLLSNGTYSVMVTNTGGGYSQFEEMAVNRWRPDALNDNGGQFIFIRNRRTGEVWSATYQPTCKKPDFYEVIYSIDKAEFRRRDGEIETHLQVVVSPDSNVEHRQLKLTNHGWHPCELEITSYVEITLATFNADVAHPAFQKLFVETEYISREAAIIAKRRPRDPKSKTIWAFHVLACSEVASEDVQFESARREFLGRGHDLRSPAAMQPGFRLTGKAGLVLDPIFSLRCCVSVQHHASVSLAFTTGISDTRDEALRMADQFHEQRSVLRAFELAWVFNQVQLHHLHLTAAKAQRFQQLASLLLFPQKHARGSENALQQNHQGQSGLWRFGISGDRPILLVNVGEAEHVEFVRELLLAHEYWDHHGLAVDLAIVNTHPGSYFDLLQEMLQQVVQEAPRKPAESKDSIFLLRSAQVPREDQWLLEAAAHVVLEARRGWVSILPASSRPQGITSKVPEAGLRRLDKAASNGQAATNGSEKKSAKWSGPVDSSPAASVPTQGLSTHPADLEFWNGHGGFADGGREYHIRIGSTSATPAPWSNVIANPRFGCLITETGGGYSWAGNSRQNKLTSWSNDPVVDPPSEVLYLRDDANTGVWLPLAAPTVASEEAWVHHGQGYSRFNRSDGQLEQEVLITIAPDDPVKLICMKLHNRGPVERRLTACYGADVVLGVCREQTRMHLSTELDKDTGAILIRNAFHPTNPTQVAFLQVIGANPSATGDRIEFLGRNGNFRNPAGLQSPTLSGKTGVGLDPWAAIQTTFTIRANETVELAFVLGCGSDSGEAQTLLHRYQTLEAIRAAADGTKSLWNEILSTIQVSTPNRGFDILVNRWLLYQVLSCRLWGRSAFYQSGGAFGFRDQLQDVMALVYARPDLARKQILLAASHQFIEGDVQHWWHPPVGEGTRTTFSDDLLWLSFVVAHYIKITLDSQVLDEVLPYLHSQVLSGDEQERYELPQVSLEAGHLYEHCVRAIDHGFRLGEHGLPLMGCGDWNDGMNHVGAHGRGESVWVGWFMVKLLDDFLPLAEARGDTAFVQRYRQRQNDLRASLEQNAWDGEWYCRAFFDDGTPLGSKQNDECQIDSIVQSWAVIAGGDSDRTDQALEAVFERLVSSEHRLVTLFDPPFDTTNLDPGYIKGYLPGVRENGGQYTHAVLWLIQALTMKGDADRAMTIFDYVNPILHARTLAEAEQYQVEPYVVAADVYSVSPHAGRGGWTWYTGSAAWTYRVALESILGLAIRGNQVQFKPCVPSEWKDFKLTLRHGMSKWNITIDVRPVSAGDITKASSHPKVATLELVDDGQEHDVTLHCRVEIPNRRHDRLPLLTKIS